MRDYYANRRLNDPAYLMKHVDELMKIAREHQNSSSLIYACLDSRIALEYIDLYLILASADDDERTGILEASKPKNGIDRLNNKYKTLKKKYQVFFQVASEIRGVKWNRHDFNKSKDLQHRLSTYIHSYYMSESDIDFNSKIMQAVFPLIQEVQALIKYSLNYNGEQYQIISVVTSTIPQEDRSLLIEWKDDNKMTEEELRVKLEYNLEKQP